MVYKILIIIFIFIPSLSAEADNLYVTDGYQNKLIVIDPKTGRSVAEIKTEVGPFDVINIEKDGKELIILSHANDKGIWIINPVTYKTEKQIPLPHKNSGPAGYFHLAYNTVYKKLYAVSRALKEVYVFNAANWHYIKTIKTGENPSGIAVSPDGRNAYITNMGSKNITVINSEDDALDKPISFNGLPNAIAISPDGKYIYVTDEENYKLFIIDSKSQKTVKELIIGIAPRGITVTPDGRYIYVSNLDSFSVSAVDANTMELIANIPVSSLPWGISSSPDGKRVYVCNYYENSVSVIDTSTNKEIERINGAVFPTKIAVSRGK